MVESILDYFRTSNSYGVLLTTSFGQEAIEWSREDACFYFRGKSVMDLFYIAAVWFECHQLREEAMGVPILLAQTLLPPVATSLSHLPQTHVPFALSTGDAGVVEAIAVTTIVTNEDMY